MRVLWCVANENKGARHCETVGNKCDSTRTRTHTRARAHTLPFCLSLLLAQPLKQGDVVVILNNSTKGWWKGKVGTKIGVFPHTYVGECEEDLDARWRGQGVPMGDPRD